ncbi:hypothetical protein VTI28DRAFT_4589 [Corynascus sepedonium]
MSEEQERSINFNRKLGGERLFLVLVGDGGLLREMAAPIYFPNSAIVSPQFWTHKSPDIVSSEVRADKTADVMLPRLWIKPPRPLSARAPFQASPGIGHTYLRPYGNEVRSRLWLEAGRLIVGGLERQASNANFCPLPTNGAINRRPTPIFSPDLLGFSGELAFSITRGDLLLLLRFGCACDKFAR